MAALLFAAFATAPGCVGTPMLGAVKNVLGDDYEAAGRTVGEAGYVAYTLIKDKPKYEKYAQKCEELYKALDDAEEVKVGTVNELAIDVCRAALTTRYGYGKAMLIMEGVRIGGAVADRIIARKVDEVAAEQFLRGFKAGIDRAREDLVGFEIEQKQEEEKKAFDCPDGNCTVTPSSRKVSHQLAIAQELIAGGYADPAETPADELSVTKYKNIEEFIERCRILKKYKVKLTLLYIKRFAIEGGRLKSIDFRMINEDGGEFEVDCVGCMDIPEIADKE
jgi:hypothetical protein